MDFFVFQTFYILFTNSDNTELKLGANVYKHCYELPSNANNALKAANNYKS